MANPSPWPIIHAERSALLEDLENLKDNQWATRSLCPAWSVRDVFGHMTATAKMTPAKFVSGWAGSGFRFHKMNEKNAAREAATPPAEGLAEFRRHLNDTTSPPGPIDAMLGEAVVHGEDIRRPLGIPHQYPNDAVIRVADFYKASNLLLGSKRRVDGVTLRATDTDWSWGSGPEVSGPILSLVLAMTGRTAAVEDLSGEGLTTLRKRM